MGDIIKPIGVWISENIPLSVGIVLFVFCLFFEISKIKVYPLKWLWKILSFPFKKIDEQRTESFKNLIVELKTDIDAKITELHDDSMKNCSSVKSCFIGLEKRFDKLDDQQRETEERLDALAAARVKNHVLNFARQIRKCEKHSHEDFANLFKENEEYQKLVKKYNWTNDVYKNDYLFIENAYKDSNNII